MPSESLYAGVELTDQIIRQAAMADNRYCTVPREVVGCRFNPSMTLAENRKVSPVLDSLLRHYEDRGFTVENYGGRLVIRWA